LFEKFLDENTQNIDSVREGESWEKYFIFLNFREKKNFEQNNNKSALRRVLDELDVMPLIRLSGLVLYSARKSLECPMKKADMGKARLMKKCFGFGAYMGKQGRQGPKIISESM
jgi:hypothetical protein